MTRPVCYVAHQLNHEDPAVREANRRRGARWCAWAAKLGVVPVADWIVLSSVWDETPELRALGLKLDCALIDRCDALLLVGGRVSDGMRIEAAHAGSYVDKGVVDLTFLGEEPPQFAFDLLARVMEAINGR